MNSILLPAAQQTQQALLGVVIQYPERLRDCARLGISGDHFQGAEQALWREIARADELGQPYNYFSLSDHLRNIHNGDGEALAHRITECIGQNAPPLLVPDYCHTLIETKMRRDTLLFAQRLMAAAQATGDHFQEVLSQAQDIASGPTRFGLPPSIDAAVLCANPPPEPPELIEGLLHRGSKLVLGGGSKSFKTWTLVDLALSVAHGVPFWDFPCEQTRVYYVNLEVEESFFCRRLNAIAHAKGITQIPGNLETHNLRGYATDAAILIPQLARLIGRNRFGLIIIDPVYKILGNRDENSSRDMADLMNILDRLAVDTGAAVAFGSHFAKGNASGKESMDRISGSGVFARDPDSILTMTRHKQDEAYTVEMTLRNHPPQEAFVVKRQHPLMVVDKLLDPRQLRLNRGRREQSTCEEVLAVLGDDALSFGEWFTKAEAELLCSRDTFKRRLQDLTRTQKVRKSPLEDRKYVKC